MKNIHILSTDKPSRVYEWGKELKFTDHPITNKRTWCQNIYITSDEEIKRIDYWLNIDNNTISNGEMFELANDAPSCKKIILTTDQDLIKDGVQAIDDEFLEWFVKNPSCEEVEVQKWFDGVDFLEYKIIIPKNERKQETLEEGFDRIFDSIDYTEFDFTSFEQGAKWQQERSYSEQDLELRKRF